MTCFAVLAALHTISLSPLISSSSCENVCMTVVCAYRWTIYEQISTTAYVNARRRTSREVKYWATLQCTCVYFGQALVVTASRDHALLNSHRLTMIRVQLHTVRGSNDERLTNVGTNEVVPILLVLVSLSSLLPPESSSARWCHCTWTLVNLLLLSASDSISTSWSHTCAHCRRLHSWALQRKLRFNPTTHDYLSCFLLGN